MRRGLLTLLALLGGGSAAWAQVHSVSAPGAETSVKVSVDEVVARIMTFDQNTDGRVAISELSERMRPLVARGDTNGDEALDPMEIHQLAHAPVTPTNRLFGSSGGYSFGDDVGLSSRRHIEGALEDLRLTADKTDRAIPIVRSYMEHIENTARASLLSQMETLISPEQFVTFSRLLDSQQHQMTFRSNAPNGERVFQVMAMVGIGNLTRLLDRLALPAPQNERARAAVEEYKTRVRLGSAAERSELIARLTDVLNDEELENYNAALQRRPVVANSFTVANLNAFPAIRGQSVGTVPALLIERVPVDVISR